MPIYKSVWWSQFLNRNFSSQMTQVIKANRNTCFLPGWLEFAKVVSRGCTCGHRVTSFLLYSMLYVWFQFIVEKIHWIIPRRLSGSWTSFLLIVPYVPFPLLDFGLALCVVVIWIMMSTASWLPYVLSIVNLQSDTADTNGYMFNSYVSSYLSFTISEIFLSYAVYIVRCYYHLCF